MTVDSHPSTHPLLPPTTEDDRASWLRLLRSRRVGPATFYRLMAEHGSAPAALDALPAIARNAGVKDYHPSTDAAARAEMDAAKKAGARMICLPDPDYPIALRGISDPPPLLWAVGEAEICPRPAIALVGARNASSLGTRMARALSAELGEAGKVIVSGLARGIDTAAHLAALENGTVAVMAGGVDVLYPAENARLANDICDRGGLRISEQPMGLTPQARHFPRRNRIISGMALAVVVVEAAAKSGSLITARTALDQGREVLAVPGHPFDARAAGCNMLIRDGALLVRSANDVLETLETAAPRDHATKAPCDSGAIPQRPACPAPPQANAPPETRSLRETAELHRRILDRLGPSPLAEDQLIRDLSASAHRVAPALLELELEGRVHRQPGGLLSRSK
ncbi:DNA-protecting protein DprA [Roseovarius sp. TE539]|uniref:DNA-processing protein DprA n=1 Tax=Roseovarius sp. TE539 TaxID=2249812 RepID=UPI000DDD2135|nr:DNA-processing protein DprA [Roseovarius sp. TE539]RBI76965.1 DNA-protecting protein DprA [Roseovarius sp. TE539]